MLQVERRQSVFRTAIVEFAGGNGAKHIGTTDTLAYDILLAQVTRLGTEVSWSHTTAAIVHILGMILQRFHQLGC